MIHSINNHVMHVETNGPRAWFRDMTYCKQPLDSPHTHIVLHTSCASYICMTNTIRNIWEDNQGKPPPKQITGCVTWASPILTIRLQPSWVILCTRSTQHFCWQFFYDRTIMRETRVIAPTASPFAGNVVPEPARISPTGPSEHPW